MAKKNIKKNYILNLCYQVLLLITPLITTPYISRVLGADGVGKVSYAESVVSYFTLFAALGISTYGKREISYVQDSIEKRTNVFWNTKVLEFVTSACALIVYTFFICTHENKGLYVVLGLNLLAVFLDVTWFFQGMEEFGKIVLRNTFFRIVNIVYVFVFVRTKDDLLVYAFGLSLFLLLSNISLWVYLPKYITRIRLVNIHPFKSLPTVISLFIPTIAMHIYCVLDKTMIGIITKSSFENGYYEQASKGSSIVLTIVTALGTVMIPRIGYLYEQGQTGEISRLMYRGYRFVWFLGIPLCLGLVCVSDNFVPWFFGSGYGRVAVLLKVLAFTILAVGINNVTGMQYLIPTKRQNIFTISVAIGACANFVLNSVLIKPLQSIGAAIATVVAEVLIAVVQLIFVRKEISPSKVLKEGINYYVAGIIMFIAINPINKLISPSIVNTGIMVLVGATVYFGTLLIMKDDFFLSNIKAIINKLIKRKKG